MVAAFRNVKAGSIEAAAKIAAFVAGLTVALTIIPKIVAAIRTIIVTLRAMTTASAIAQAFGGPAGWVSLAASVAIAAGAVYGVGEAFDAMESSSSAAAGAVSDVSSAMDAIEEVSDAVDTATSAVDEYAEKWKGIGERIADSVTTPVEKIRQRIAEIREAFSGGFIDTETATRAIVAARDELDALGKERDAFSATPSIGAAVRGTSGGFSAVQDGQRVMKDIAASAKKREDSDKRREKLLADMLSELESIAESTEKPLKVKEYDII